MKKTTSSHKISKVLAAAALTGLLALAVTGCGSSSGNDPDTDTNAQTETTAGDSSQSDTSSNNTDASSESSAGTASSDSAASAGAASPADGLEGKWVYVYTMTTSQYGNEDPYDYVTMATDEYAPESFFNIRKKDGKFIADYKFSGFESDIKYYGNELIMRNEPAYDGCETSWYLEFSDPFDDLDEESHKITLLDDGRLFDVSEYKEEAYEDYEGYFSRTTAVYLRDDSPLLDDIEELRYFDTVTVSNAVDLLNSIQNNRRIICEAGKYNFSEVIPREIDNPKVTTIYGTSKHKLTDISNISIEAADGADVEFLINDAYEPVFAIDNGTNIKLTGITAGHNVQPGYCSGSVLSFDYVTGLDIDNCHLYGCGTYGIEASYSYDINVTNSEIYECTYGLLDLSQIGVANFSDCVFRDSSDMSMICVNGSYGVTFENCIFKNNNSMSYESCSFVEIGEYDKVTFRNCNFSANEYYTFSNREVTLEDCTADNNHAGFNDLIGKSGTLSKDELLALYDETLAKQKEKDDKYHSDGLLDQLTLNQMAFEDFDMWDSLINKVWAYLKNTLSEEEMATLTEEQQAWIKEKEAAIKDAGAEFDGGSMQPMIEYAEGADQTQARVKYLIDNYVRK